MVPISRVNGTIVFVDANAIVVLDEDGEEHTHFLQKYQRSNQDTCLNQLQSFATVIRSLSDRSWRMVPLVKAVKLRWDRTF
jgi:DNA-directed RNA polymerase beta subunit